jgi:hypothetical protein
MANLKIAILGCLALTWLFTLTPITKAETKSIAEQMESIALSASLIDDDDLNLPSIYESEYGKPKTKSRFLALGLSLLLPGAGQYYTDHKSKTGIFGSAEAAIWGGFLGLRQYGSWKKDDYRAWAAYHAGADINDKSDLYFEKLTYYDNVDQYNQLAPLYDGDEATLFLSPNDYWNWDTDGNRNHYRSLRNQSKNAYRRSLFLVGAAIINRILAGIDAYRAADYYGDNSEFGAADISSSGGLGWTVYYESTGPLWDSELEIGLVKRF